MTVYVQADEVKNYLYRAAVLAGKFPVPPAEIPTGTFARMGDPEGNLIGLWKLK